MEKDKGTKENQEVLMRQNMHVLDKRMVTRAEDRSAPYPYDKKRKRDEAGPTTLRRFEALGHGTW